MNGPWESFARTHTMKAVESLLKHCNDITKLQLKQCGDVDDQTLLLLAQKYPFLKHLHLNGCRKITDQSLIALGKHCLRLTILSLSCNPNRGEVSSQGVQFLLQQCRSLDALHLSHLDDNTIEGSANKLHSSSSVSTITLYNCSSIRNNYAILLLVDLTRLQHLDLSYSSGVSSAVLVAIIQNNRNLRKIDFSRINTVNNCVVQAMAACCSQLEEIEIELCLQVTELSALSSCLKLNFVDIIGCTRVSSASLLLLAVSLGPRFDIYAYRCPSLVEAEESLRGSLRVALKLLKFF